MGEGPSPIQRETFDYPQVLVSASVLKTEPLRIISIYYPQGLFQEPLQVQKSAANRVFPSEWDWSLLPYISAYPLRISKGALLQMPPLSQVRGSATQGKTFVH